VPGSDLHYDVADLTLPWIGEPQTILFHHGLGASSRTWVAWLPVLADRYRLVRFDMRGHGRSASPGAKSSVSAGGAATAAVTLSLDLLADDVFAVADAVGARDFHLVGESIGGTIALLAASRRAERVRTLTVSNGAHLGGSIQNINDWRDIMAAGGMAGWSRHMMSKRFFEGAIGEPMWRWYEREQASASSDFVLQAVRLLAGADLSAQLERLRMPVLLLHGDSSPFIPVAVMADLKSRLLDARLQVFAHARHGLPFSHGKECAQTLRRFLEEVGARTEGAG
jgi:pimeloyl-ACP methyl ester carboxylesterase